MNINDFLSQHEINPARVQRMLTETLGRLDDGELYLEHKQAEAISYEDGRVRTASFHVDQGFGLRAVHGEAVAYAHSNELSHQALDRAAQMVKNVDYGQKSMAVSLAKITRATPLYGDDNPLMGLSFEPKIVLLQHIDAYLRQKSPHIHQVTCSLTGSWQWVAVMRANGEMAEDIRPLVRINIAVVLKQGDRMESGSSGYGGREAYGRFVAETMWRAHADEALRQAEVNMQARPAPAGEWPVVLGAGWCGVLLHEAVGHGLEGDFNRKGLSTFSGRIGERVASPGVTVVDNGTLPNRRGSLSMDDEGTPTAENILIEDGILKGYMQDRLNARLMGVAPTGNGRRESYAHQPMPRMTNTYMLSGNHSREEMIASVKKGIYAPGFSGGQVDITSGKFVFNASEAYLIENGKVQYPVKGATLIGSGPEVMQRIQMIGHDSALDEGIGTCGKAGQSVPVGVGQPSMLIEKLTIGGTEAI